MRSGPESHPSLVQPHGCGREGSPTMTSADQVAMADAGEEAAYSGTLHTPCGFEL